jgi:hypothetical protein
MMFADQFVLNFFGVIFTQTLTFSVLSYSFLLYIYGFDSCPIVTYVVHSSWNGDRKHDSVLINFH